MGCYNNFFDSYDLFLNEFFKICKPKPVEILWSEEDREYISKEIKRQRRLIHKALNKVRKRKKLNPDPPNLLDYTCHSKVSKDMWDLKKWQNEPELKEVYKSFERKKK